MSLTHDRSYDAEELLPYQRAIERIAPLIREHADAAEREARLPNQVAEAMAHAGLYRVAAPRSVGGGETHPFTQMRVIELVANVDGSAGWNLMIGIETTGILGSLLGRERAEAIYADPLLIVSGALNPRGSAEAVDGGYRVSGQWPFASGCHNSQYFWGQCVVHQDGEPVRDEGGRTKVLEVVVPASEYEIVETWDVAGLRGSGSHDVAVRDRFVPAEMTTNATRRPSRETGPLFRMPLYSRLAYNKMGVATGIARAALDHFQALASTKTPRGSRTLLNERVEAQIAMANAEATLRSARAFVFESVGEMWETVLRGDAPSAEQRALVQLACSNAASAAVDAVGHVHAASGASANFRTNPLERCFRDVQVVRQQIMASPQWIRSAGRVLLGLQSDAYIL
ncbi:MAG: acyl-CoA dehydrogenase family protein [Gammaproteobacteria bacterium]|jgi:alkylation response protein AidB-like acyl-CoA dehydrogenase